MVPYQLAANPLSDIMPCLFHWQYSCYEEVPNARPIYSGQGLTCNMTNAKNRTIMIILPHPLAARPDKSEFRLLSAVNGSIDKVKMRGIVFLLGIIMISCGGKGTGV